MIHIWTRLFSVIVGFFVPFNSVLQDQQWMYI